MHNFQEETEGIEDDTPTELQSAAAAGDLTQVLSILNDKPTSVHDAPRGYYGLTALQFACQNVHIPCVLALLRAGANVNAPGGNNATRPALAIAAAGGDPDLVRLLLEWGADVNAPAGRYHGRTALQAAASSEDVKLVRLLLSRGADVNAPASKHKGLTALQASALTKDLHMVDLLLGSGADINAAGSHFKGGSALHAAAESGSVQIVQRLLEKGHDVNALSGWNAQTSLQSAAATGHDDVVSILRSAGAEGPLAGGAMLFESR